jgi:hypothetical protein
MSKSKSVREIAQHETNLVETQAEKEWVLKIVDLLQEENNKLRIDGAVHSNELTALKETDTNISTKQRAFRVI